jgi:SAM-dependent methyltransferase
MTVLDRWAAKSDNVGTQMGGALQSGGERIDLLGVNLLLEEKPTVEAFRHLADRLGVQIGWHYLLDLSWAAHQLEEMGAAEVLDAGAGLGLMQWWLAGRGVRVLSVDRQSRQELPFRFRAQYHVSGLRREDLLSPADSLRRRLSDRTQPYGRRAGSAARAIAGWIMAPLASKALGSVVLYHQDLTHLADVRSDSLDAVVAISSLEHNSPETLPPVVRELMRVVKPGGRLVATLGAAKQADWFHEPSQGWCYTDASLRKLFELESGVTSNYRQYDELMSRLRASDELRLGLAPFHFTSGDNGMPWGAWDPRYQPVGVVKVKRGRAT